MLNHMCERHQYTVHPWLHTNCNHLSDADQLRAVAVPDVLPSQLVQGPGLMSMCAGDFVVRASPGRLGLCSASLAWFGLGWAGTYSPPLLLKRTG